MLQPECVLQNRYQLDRVLGQSASRQTWLARDLKTHNPVVVKLLPFNDQVRWDEQRLFEREAQVLRQLNHPHIPRYRDYFCIDDRLLWFGLVQDYVRGLSLKEMLNRGNVFSEPEVRSVARQVLEVLIYLHELSPPVLHRDIKPSNLIWGQDDHIVLVDFGAVQDRAAKESVTFTVVGTYGYAPLEQLGGRATPASDLYALGATLIHLLTGIAPADLPQQNARLQFADLVRLNPGFVRWLQTLTEPNQSRRLSNARQALAVLDANERAIAAFSSLKPTHSQIQLQKSSQRLEILIPNETWRKVTIWLLPLILILLAVLIRLPVRGPFGNILLLTISIPSLFALSLIWLPKLGVTRITFDHRQFMIESRRFGICLRRQLGQVSEINQMLSSRKKPLGHPKDTDKSSDITLSVGVREYAFSEYGRALTRSECHWLAEEIRQWLGLSEIVVGEP